MRNRRRYRPRAVETTFSARDAETLATAAKFSTMNTRRTLRIFDRAISSSGERTIVRQRRSERVLSVSLVVHFSAIRSNRFLEWRIRRTFYIFLPLDWHSVENAIDLAILIIIDIRSLLYRDRIISAIKRNRIVYTPRIRTNMNKWIEMVRLAIPSVAKIIFSFGSSLETRFIRIIPYLYLRTRVSPTKGRSTGTAGTFIGDREADVWGK